MLAGNPTLDFREGMSMEATFKLDYLEDDSLFSKLS